MKKANLQNYTQLSFLKPILDFTGGYIAGGCFKNIFNKEKIKDVDVFFEKEEDYKRAYEKISLLIKEGNNPNYKFVYENDNCYCYRDKRFDFNIELIHKEYAPVKEMLEMFDFSIAKFALFVNKNNESENFYDSMNVMYSDDYFEHLHTKRLVIEDDLLMYPISTFNRVLKYTKYGYGLCRESKIKLLRSLLMVTEEDLDNNGISMSLYDGFD